MDVRLTAVAVAMGLLIGLVCAESDDTSAVRVRTSSWVWALFAGYTLDYMSGSVYSPDTSWGYLPWTLTGIVLAYPSIYAWNRFWNASSPIPYDVRARNVATILLIVVLVYGSALAGVINPRTRESTIESYIDTRSDRFTR